MKSFYLEDDDYYHGNDRAEEKEFYEARKRHLQRKLFWALFREELPSV
jgi:hypothetical protein